ncbi:MAG: S8 family serine peptidase [Chloroflexi bacterium]|nr:S8 family serine peptidase [Chloroflexota bacterium]
MKFRLTGMVFILLLVLSFAGSISADTRQQPPNTVTIIVVDNFETTQPEAVEAEDEEICVISAEEQGYAVRGFSDEDTLDAHGDIVIAEIEESLTELGANPDDFDIVQVQLSQDAQVLADELETAINDSSSDFIVVNLSMGLIPCEFIEAMQAFGGEFLEANEAKDLNRYRGIFQRAVVFYDNQVFPAVSTAFQEADDLHPLQSVIAANQSNTIAIASAGNFGLDQPFWPAAWGQVVSVSASSGQGFEAPMAWVEQGSDKDMPLLSVQGQGNNTDRISNYGEIMIPGEYEVTSEGGTVMGTSFAAPRLTAVVAVYLANEGSFCTNDDGYFALATGDFDNRTLSAAANDSCPALVPYLP